MFKKLLCIKVLNAQMRCEDGRCRTIIYLPILLLLLTIAGFMTGISRMLTARSAPGAG
jgi:hypothetical protein